jgi:hypothetical protein
MTANAAATGREHLELKGGPETAASPPQTESSILRRRRSAYVSFKLAMSGTMLRLAVPGKF